MEPRHTPGPWHVPSRTYAMAMDRNGRRVANCQGDAAVPRAEQEANAALVAAAPELAEELEAATALLGRLTVLALTPAIQDHLPHGTRELVAEYMKRRPEAVLRRAGRPPWGLAEKVEPPEDTRPVCGARSGAHRCIDHAGHDGPCEYRPATTPWFPEKPAAEASCARCGRNPVEAQGDVCIWCQGPRA